jgi:hypothetical protein
VFDERGFGPYLHAVHDGYDSCISGNRFAARIDTSATANGNENDVTFAGTAEIDSHVARGEVSCS